MLFSYRAWLVSHNLRNDTGRDFHPFRQRIKGTAYAMQGKSRQGGDWCKDLRTLWLHSNKRKTAVLSLAAAALYAQSYKILCNYCLASPSEFPVPCALHIVGLAHCPVIGAPFTFALTTPEILIATPIT